MGRLRVETIERAEAFADGMLAVAREMNRKRCSRRIVDQVVGCGTSVAANVFEADEAMSRPDFCKTLGIVIKEANEARFWLRLAMRQGWAPREQLQALEKEACELKKMFGHMVNRTRAADKV